MPEIAIAVSIDGSPGSGAGGSPLDPGEFFLTATEDGVTYDLTAEEDATVYDLSATEEA
jgi:hypothetical protein